jgi:hypothetical protein
VVIKLLDGKYKVFGIKYCPSGNHYLLENADSQEMIHFYDQNKDFSRIFLTNWTVFTTTTVKGKIKIKIVRRAF